MPDLSSVNEFVGKVGFATGSGRCGCRWLYELLDQEKGVAASKERHPLEDTLRKYESWKGESNSLNDYLVTKENSIRDDLRDKAFSFESNPFLALSMKELYNRFQSKFIILIRKPERVIRSLENKGWYENDSKESHHYYGRIKPLGDEQVGWEKLTRIGKLAWYWNAVNNRILDELKGIPKKAYRIEKLEDLEMSFEKYSHLIEFLGFKTSLSEASYRQSRMNRPESRSHQARHYLEWTQREVSEFLERVRPMAMHYGYAHEWEDVLKQNATKAGRTPLQAVKANAKRLWLKTQGKWS